MPLTLNLSYSSLETLHTCPRKYELDKLVTGAPDTDPTNVDLVCGTSFGLGIAKYFETGNLEESIWAAYLGWTFPSGFTAQTCSIIESNKKKTFHHVIAHLEKYSMLRHFENMGYEIHTLPSGRPAVEVGFRIALPGGKYYRGYIDVILYHPASGDYAVVEVKTSGFKDASRTLFQNSFQGMSYAFILDYITGRSNPIQYNFVAEFPDLGQQVMDFYRSPNDKISWIPSLAFDIKDIERYAAAGHFPMRGGSCFSFYRDCKFLGVCNLPRPAEYKQHKLEADSMYDYNFTLEELLAARASLYS